MMSLFTKPQPSPLKELHVMCGIQGSGKTTLAKQLVISKNAVLYNYDTIFWESKTYTPILDIYKQMKLSLLQGKNIIYDNLNITVLSREFLLKYFKRLECKKIIHVMNTPLEECLKRRQERAVGQYLSDCHVLSCYKDYVPPVFEEGWDEIIYHNV